MKSAEKDLSAEATEVLLTTLKSRFLDNKIRHNDLDWLKVETKLRKQPQKLWSLNEMENTGGEPDLTGYDKKKGEYLFMDCSPESPEGRRSLCYDRKALDARKKNKPKSSAMEMATSMGIDLMTEEEYRYLQSLGDFDTKTSSWLKTPDAIRKHGGAIFGDFRYQTVFVYHNGADSYYAARGFRGVLRV